jgi:transposase
MDDAALLELPDDPALLKRMIADRNAAIVQREAVIAERERHIEAIEQRHRAEIDALLRRLYGPRSEKFDPAQLLIFGLEVAENIPVDEKAAEAEGGERLVTRRVGGANGHHKHGRGKLPEHLPRIQIVHDLTAEQIKCPCCGEQRCRIGSEASEQLEYVPASFKVLRHVRHKYACKACDGAGKGANIEIATKSAAPIEKGLPGPGLLAHVIVSKLGDHLPLYRLENIFARHDVSLSRSTMCAWMLAASTLVKPLADLLAERVRQGRVIHTDDTTVKVQDASLKGRCRTGRVWTYIGDEANPYVAYDYTPDRARAGPQRWLEKFAGYLQADAYGGYDGIYAREAGGGTVTEVACWAHARRKFFEARETDGRRATQMLEFVRQLYAVEGEARGLDHDARRALRQERSVPVLARIKSWLDAEQPVVLQRSPMGAAITYCLNQWEALCRYAEQGYLNIDNNAAERALRRVAIGRKNWLFAGTDEAGASHARLWTLIASAERHGLCPQRYLTSVMAKIGQAKLSELGQFLPDAWKAEDAASPPPVPTPSSRENHSL